jgi:hypothetical protein
MGHRTLGWKTLLLSASLLLLLQACGPDDPVEHGLKTEPLESRPEGGAVEVRYDVEDGARYVATIDLSMRVVQQRRGGRSTAEKAQRVEGSAVLSLSQTFAVPGGERRPTSRIDLRYTQARGPSAEDFLARAPVTGALLHDAEGRARLDSLRLDGGSKTAQVEALDLIGALFFAGFAGSPAWMPARPVQPGEAWQVEGFLRPRGMDNVIREARRMGVSAPTPTLTGTLKLERVEESPAGPLLHLQIDALIEIEGKFHKDGQGGRMSVGDRTQGTAIVSARTGLPTHFDVTHTRRTDIRSSGEHVEQHLVSTLHGVVKRTDQAEPANGR